MKLYYIERDCINPYINLALEECILNRAEEDEAFLYLWQNRNTVVIGKNQNPWRECNLASMERDGCKLSRRITGGGAVYHDMGNLNFSFIIPKRIYSLEIQFSIIVQTLAAYGVKAQFSGRNDLLVEGSKFSGNAFCHRFGHILHHGTLLINSDFSKFPMYLKLSNKKMQSKGVASVQSRVTNLNQYADITVENIRKPLANTFADIYKGDLEDYPIDSILQGPEFTNLAARNQSKEWLYHTSPKFNVSLEERFHWGEVQLFINVEKGIISEISCFSDSLDENISDTTAASLKGIAYDASELLALDKTNSQLSDILHLIVENI